MVDEFAEGWITEGWSRVEGKWVEVGAVAGVTMSPAFPPELTVHQVADKLNEYQLMRDRLMDDIALYVLDRKADR